MKPGNLYILILLLFTIIFLSCFPEKEQDQEFIPIGDQPPRAMVIYDSRNSDCKGIAGELEKAAQYTKIPLKLLDIGILKRQFNIPKTIQTIAFSLFDGKMLSDEEFEEILQFIVHGGKVVILTPSWDPRFFYLQGMKFNASASTNVHARGFHFYSNILPGMKNRGFIMKNVPIHNGFKLENFKPSVKILVTAENDRSYPVVLKNKIGNGEVIFFNTSILNDKLYRGLITSAMVHGLSGIPYLVANVSMIFIDDFPAPLYDTKMPPIDKEYGLTHKDFIYQIWWPDMKHLADSLNVDYTTFIAFNYNSTVTPPYGFEQWEAQKIKFGNRQVFGCKFLAQDVKNSRHELAFHGYNHFSLMESEWPDMQFVGMALKAVRKKWISDDLGDLPKSYVAPTNYIDSSGLHYLKRGLRSLEYMATLYLGEKESGGDREFDPDPYNPDLFDMPRITSGYYFDDEKLFTQESMYFFTGIWTHFIHPDDIFQVVNREDDPFASRNELGLWWKHTPHDPRSMYGELAKWMGRSRNVHPFIRYWTVNRAGAIIKPWRMSQLLYNESGDSLRVKIRTTGMKPNWLWNLYVPSESLSQMESYLKQKQIKFSKQNIWDGFLLEFPANRDSLTLPLLRFRRHSVNYHAIRRNFKLFLAKATGLDWQKIELENLRDVIAGEIRDSKLEERAIQLSVEGERVPVAIKILERRLLTQEKWTKKDVDRWLEYLYWENQINTLPLVLRERVHRFPTESSFKLKQYISGKLGNFSEMEEDWWLRKKMKIFPDSLSLQIRFINQHPDKSDWPEMKKWLIRLIRNGESPDSLTHTLIQRSLWYDKPEETLKLIEALPAEKVADLNMFSHDIAELYAYARKDLTRAVLWENNAAVPDSLKIGNWLWEAGRYAEYFELMQKYRRKNQLPDSTLHSLGRTWLAEGFILRGFKYILESRVPQTDAYKKENLSAFNSLRLTEKEKLNILLEYKSLFQKHVQDSLSVAISRYYSPRLTTMGEVETDNFKNDHFKAGVAYSAGNRHRKIKQIGIQRHWVNNPLKKTKEYLILNELNISLESIFEKAGKKITAMVGGVLNKGTPLLTAYFQYGFGEYQSYELKTMPVMTYQALNKRIQMIQGSWYGENTLFDKKPETVLYASGKYFSDGNWIGESTARLLPFHKNLLGGRLKTVFEISLQDATKLHQSGYPYWTPDWIYGGGMGLLFDRRGRNSELTAELMTKWDRESGGYLAMALTSKFYVRKYWYLQTRASWSDSKLYRSNGLFMGISYLFH